MTTSVNFDMATAQAAIRNAIDRLDDPTPMFQEIAEYMTEATRKRFLTGTAPDGSAWAPKSASTLARYKRLGYGTLTKPLIGPGRRLSREIVTQSNRNGAVIGSSLIYSGVMQEGAAKGAFGANKKGRPIPWGKIPARVWLGVSAADETKLIAIAEEYVAEPLDAPG